MHALPLLLRYEREWAMSSWARGLITVLQAIDLGPFDKRYAITPYCPNEGNNETGTSDKAAKAAIRSGTWTEATYGLADVSEGVGLIEQQVR